MLKDRFNKIQKFTKEHQTEIVGVVCLTAIAGLSAYAGYKVRSSEIKELTRLLKDKTKLAKEACEYCKSRINIDVECIKDSINVLDSGIPVNKYIKIPKRKAQIRELLLQRSMIDNMIKCC